MCQYITENKQVRKTMERKTCISNMDSQPNLSGQGSEVNADPTPVYIVDNSDDNR